MTASKQEHRVIDPGDAQRVSANTLIRLATPKHVSYSNRVDRSKAHTATGEKSSSKGNLQDAFEQFQKQRKGQKMDAKKAKQAAHIARQASPEFKMKLREKFLARAKTYLGVPYGKRYHSANSDCTCEGCTEKGVQLYQEPLFLDCCALVRRCVRDLKYDFGFQLGGGNQSYQIDTLPIRVASVHDLEPGDLIFYEGEYHNKSQRRPVHDMVHVEIFTGSGTKGEGVIGEFLVLTLLDVPYWLQ